MRVFHRPAAAPRGMKICRTIFLNRPLGDFKNRPTFFVGVAPGWLLMCQNEPRDAESWQLLALLLHFSLMDNKQTELVGRALAWSALVLLLAAVAGISFISMGLFDPPVVGATETKVALDRVLTTDGEQVEWLEVAPSSDLFTVRLAAAYTQGERDSGYGLALGTADDYMTVAVSPVGYVTMFARNGSPIRLPASASILSWQPWPHVWVGEKSNEFWLEAKGEQLSVRLNRELLWQGTWAGRGRGVGLYLVTYNQPVTITFQSLTIQQ